MDAHSAILEETNVRAMVRLLVEVIAAPGEISEKRRMLMDGLCRLIGATSWAWCRAEFDPEKPPSFIGFEHGDCDEDRFVRYVEAMNHPDMASATRPTFIELKEKGESSAAAYWARADIGTLLISQRPTEGGGTSGMGVFRRLGEPHFDEREAKIAHIILSEVPWLHFRAFPDENGQEITRLYPRHRTVLNLLCEGWSRKKIAEHLGIGLNTVNGYAKAIFKHFGVHSQSELLTRTSKGDGREP